MHDAVERQALVAAHVHARSGRVIAERTQLFDGSISEGVPVRKGIAVSLGAVSPERTWELPLRRREQRRRPVGRDRQLR